MQTLGRMLLYLGAAASDADIHGSRELRGALEDFFAKGNARRARRSRTDGDTARHGRRVHPAGGRLAPTREGHRYGGLLHIPRDQQFTAPPQRWSSPPTESSRSGHHCRPDSAMAELLIDPVADANPSL
jgi:hypothetical protein